MEKENIESALLEHRRFPPPDSFVARARLRPQEVEAMRRKAEADHVGYWADLARKSLAEAVNEVISLPTLKRYRVGLCIRS